MVLTRTTNTTGALTVVHNLATTNGRTAMMNAAEVSWHGPEAWLHEPATAREAIEAARLDSADATGAGHAWNLSEIAPAT